MSHETPNNIIIPLSKRDKIIMAQVIHVLGSRSSLFIAERRLDTCIALSSHSRYVFRYLS
jgi:hypothetical protein